MASPLDSVFGRGPVHILGVWAVAPLNTLMAEGKSWSPPGTLPFSLLSLVVQVLPVEDSGPAHEAGLLQGLATNKEKPLQS